MEIRNRDDAEFILKNRASREMFRLWKGKIRLVLWSGLPLVIYAICIICTYPNAGEAGYPDVPANVGWGIMILLLYYLVAGFCVMVTWQKDRDYLKEHYMEVETKAGRINKDETSVSPIKMDGNEKVVVKEEDGDI